jgi:hypothetical protein
LARREDLGVYSHDWFLHASNERYLMAVLRCAKRTLETVAYQSTNIEPGCILLTRCAQSKRWNHGAIAIGGNKAVHALHPAVSEFNIGLHPMWAYHEISIFDPFLK